MPIITIPDRLLNLPIFHKCYNFIIVLSDYTSKFPKKERYTLGIKIENTAYEFLALIMRANYSHGPLRENLLREASITLDLLKVFVRLGKDKKALQMKHYLILEERLQEIGRMLGGWIKSFYTKRPA